MTTRRDFLKAGAAMGALVVAGPRLARATPVATADAPDREGPSGGAAATYTLLLEITGLALLVVDKEQTPQLRVLFPKTDNAMKHEIRAYSTLWDANGIPISGDITVPAVAGTPSLAWQDGLENLTSVYESKVDPVVAKGTFGSRLEGRLNIQSGSVAGTSTWRGRWLIYTELESVDLSPLVVWQCTLPTTAQPLPGTALPTITPAAGSTVTIEVRHAPAAEQGASPSYPGKPGFLKSAQHFQFVKGLFDPKLKGDLHWLWELGTRPLTYGITPFSCMVGGGEIGP